MGADVAYFAVLCVGSVILSVWVGLSDPVLTRDLGHAWLLAVNGMATATMTVLLYAGLARGPVAWWRRWSRAIRCWFSPSGSAWGRAPA